MVRRGTATRAGKAVWTLAAIGGYVTTAGAFAGANLASWAGGLIWAAVWIVGLVAIQWWEGHVWDNLATDVGFDRADEWTPYSILWSERPSLEGTVDGRRVTVGTRIDRTGSSWALPRTVVSVTT